MEWTATYIISQVFVLIMYVLLASTYFVKKRKVVLILSFLCIIANLIAYILLEAYSGIAMCIIAIIRNIIFMIDKNKDKEKNDKKDFIILGVLYIISIISAIFTYEGFLSLFSVFATMLYTYSVWQKNVKIYKLLGIPIGILWVIYNIYIFSIFSTILESILLICSTTGYFLHKNKELSREVKEK